MSSSNNVLVTYPADRVIRLQNVNCPYCGLEFSDIVEPSKEHVIGRKFVPKGSLNGAPNLILRACIRCNRFKSDLEDDISVIAMHPDAVGRYPVDDERLRSEVARKARKAISRHTRRPVAEAEPPLVIRALMGDAFQMTFTMRSPPHLSEGRAFLLARLQLQAFFFLLSYKLEERRGYFWLGDFQPLIAVRQGDWGNPKLIWFEKETKIWLPRFNLVTADGFYKVWIRRKSEETAAWAWAIEWNQNFRLAGFFGADEVVQPCLDSAPHLKMQTLSETDREYVKVRTEIPLASENDTLFEFQ